MRHNKQNALLWLIILLASTLVAGRIRPATVFVSPHTFGDGRVVTAVTVEFRRGYQGYAGVSDTYLLNELTPVARGAEWKLHIKELGGGSTTKRTLMRFDLSSIPPNANVTVAWLELYLIELISGKPVGVNLYRLLKPWSEANATWTSTGLGQDWAVAGAGGEGNDREAAPFATGTLGTLKAYNRIDVLEAVRRWVREPESNYGFIIMGTSSAEARVWSSEDTREGEQPRLIVTYELPQDTPGPTRTPTTALTPTAGPSPTTALTPTAGSSPTPPSENVITSFGPYDAFTSDDADFKRRNCIEAGPTAGNPNNTRVLLMWQGTPSFARLTFKYAGNNNRRHSVLVNDQVIGRLPGDNYSSVCSGGSAGMLYFDPSVLVNGVNKVSIVADVPGETNSWSMQDIHIELGGNVLGPTIVVKRDIPSTWDPRFPQRAIIQKPVGYRLGTPTPLVLGLHGWGGRDFDALMWLAKACNERGWLLACSDTRGPSVYTASPAVQRDIIDLIDYMVNSAEFSVDTSRVYIVGPSLGGMMAATIAAKYPDRFAALVELKGPTRLDTWYYDVEPWRQERIYNEIKAYPSANPFAYQSRSAGYMARNLRNVPTAIVHGLRDTLVDFQKHARYLADEMAKYGNPPLLAAYDGGHADDHPEWTPERIMSFFSQYTLNVCPSRVTVRTPEGKTYYWLGISYAASDHWTNVDASFDRDTKTITAEVYDERVPAIPVDITFDLVRMGLPTNVPYTVEDLNLDTGDFVQTVVASTTSLTYRVQGDRHRLVAYPFEAPTPQTLILSQGSDTFIEAYAVDVNHEGEEKMTLSDGGMRVPLIRFDLASVPRGIVIKGAQLNLSAIYRWGSATSLDTTVYRLLRPWEAGQATWLNAAAGQGWAKPGALGADEDYDPTPVARRTMSAYPATYSYNVSGLVRRWLEDPESNYGLLLRGEGGSCNFNLASSEHANPNMRPKLVIQYTYPTPMPTPTNTFAPSPTATPAWTPTPAGQGGIYLPVLLK